MHLKSLEPEAMPVDERPTHEPYQREYRCPTCQQWRPMIRRGEKPPCGQTAQCNEQEKSQPAEPLKEWSGKY